MAMLLKCERCLPEEPTPLLEMHGEGLLLSWLDWLGATSFPPCLKPRPSLTPDLSLLLHPSPTSFPVTHTPPFHLFLCCDTMPSRRLLTTLISCISGASSLSGIMASNVPNDIAGLSVDARKLPQLGIVPTTHETTGTGCTANAHSQ